jgi:hypothetical protein
MGALVDLIKHIPQNRRWIPCQVHEELRRNSIDDLANDLAEDRGRIEAVRTSLRQLRDSVGGELSQFADIERLVDEIASSLPWSLQCEEWERRFEEISSLFTIGCGFSPPRLYERWASAAERCSLSIPPGYKDKGKKGLRQYGDVMIWFEIIDEAKARHLPVVLVIDEQKEDWWEKAGDRRLGPQPSLVQELRHEAQTELMMCTSAEFMERSKCLDAAVPRDLVEKASTDLATETAAATSQEAMTVAQWASAILALPEMAQWDSAIQALPEMAQTVLNSASQRLLTEAAASISLAAQRAVADSSIQYGDFIQMVASAIRGMSVQNPPEQHSPPTPDNENK